MEPSSQSLNTLLHVSNVQMEPRAFAYQRFSTVYKGEIVNERSSVVVMVKMWRALTRSQEQVNQFSEFVEPRLMTWKKIEHPNIAPLLGTVILYNAIPSTVLQFYQNGDANRYIRDHPNVDILGLINGIASGLSFLHTSTPSIAHGDLRGSNILISDDGMPLVSDIGMGNIPFPPHWIVESSEAIRWLAPEIMFPEEEESGIRTSLAGDIYSLGMTMLELYTGQEPFSYVRALTAVVRRVVDGIRPQRPECDLITDDIWDVIQSCWSHNPIHRPDIETVSAWLEIITRLRRGVTGESDHSV